MKIRVLPCSVEGHLLLFEEWITQHEPHEAHQMTVLSLLFEWILARRKEEQEFKKQACMCSRGSMSKYCSRVISQSAVSLNSWTDSSTNWVSGSHEFKYRLQMIKSVSLPLWKHSQNSSKYEEHISKSIRDLKL